MKVLGKAKLKLYSFEVKGWKSPWKRGQIMLNKDIAIHIQDKDGIILEVLLDDDGKLVLREVD